jgi:ABC-type glutathione transport system ATPase component
MIIINDLQVRAEHHLILDGVSFILAPDTNLFVVGESGSGKSTLLEVLAGRSPHRISGTVSRVPGPIYEDRRAKILDRREDNVVADWDGPERRHTEEDRRRPWLEGTLLAIQDANDAFSPFWRLYRQLPDAPALASAGPDRLADCLRELGLAPEWILHAYPSELSAGMLKRVLIGALLTSAPSLALFDEPTAGIDPSRRWAVLETIRERTDCFVIATHDVRLLQPREDDYVLVMRDGKIVEKGTAEALLNHPFRPYTKQLLARRNR